MGPQVPADVAAVLLTEPAGADPFEGIDQLVELDLGRVAHQEVHVVVLAVELFQLAFSDARCVHRELGFHRGDIDRRVM
ncbi:hypothetical protein AR457_36900 [Streptomyces agglomeratus]|nr:hypothetical protein AR457_36900 [Streptomyces agglomeratus]